MNRFLVVGIPVIIVLLGGVIALLVVIAHKPASDPLYDECLRQAARTAIHRDIEAMLVRGCDTERERRRERQRDPIAADERDCWNRLVLLGANGGQARLRCKGGGSAEASAYIECRERAFRERASSAEIDVRCKLR